MSAPPLPAALEVVVARVLAAADLPVHERHEVELDLRAHFEDGLEAGADADTLLRRFGDPEAAGRRIARTRAASSGRARGLGGGWRAGGDRGSTELRRAVRTLARAPGFSLVVVLTLALGVGANTAVFSVLNAVILEDLPYPDADRLVRVYSEDPENPGDLNYLRAPSSLAFHRDKEALAGFATIYTYREAGADLTDGDRAERAVVSPVSAGYFETLGVPPLLGRTFREEESAGPGEAARSSDHVPVAVLSWGLWVRRFGGDREVLGRTVHLDGVAHEIVGVMPRGFANPFGSPADLWIPQDLRPGGSNTWGNWYLSGIGRLKEGETLAVAQERLRSILTGLAATAPRATQSRPVLVPLHDDVVGPTRRPMLWLLVGAAALVLLSACVNVANLVLARGLGRERELALRGALGAGRAGLLVHVVAEGVVLAALGGSMGVAVGWLGLRGVLALAPDTLPVLAHPGLGVEVFLFASLATTVALVLFSLAPALRLTSVAPADVLRAGDRGGTHGPRLGRLRDGLVVVQVAVALVLLTGAGLLVRSLERLGDVPLGVDPDGVLTFEVNLPDSRYPDGAARVRLHEALDARLAALPGVRRVGAVSWLPVNGRYHIWGFYWDPAHPDQSNDEAWYGTDVRVFDGDYFGAMGIPVLRGQGAAAVRPEGEGQVWVSQTVVRQVFGDTDPVGQRISVNGDWRRIAGVVADVAYDARGSVSRTVYVPHVQFADDRNWTLLQVVRTDGDPEALVERARAALAELDPSLVLYRPKSFEAHLASARARDRFATTLMAAFAALAVVLTVVGTYGVLSAAVARRTREIGIRMALGAGRTKVLGLVLRHAAGVAGFGLALGLVGAWIAGRWVRALLFEVEPTDPLVTSGALLLLAGVSLFSGWLPARRAARLDPARTLTE